MLSRSILNNPKSRVERVVGDAGQLFPTIKYYNGDNYNYLTLTPGLAMHKPCVILENHGEFIPYIVDAPSTTIIYYLSASLKTLLEESVYKCTGYNIKRFGVPYYDPIHDGVVFCNWLLTPSPVAAYHCDMMLIELTM